MRRFVLMEAAGAVRSTPTAALGAFLSIEPIKICETIQATKAYFRIKDDRSQPMKEGQLGILEEE